MFNMAQGWIEFVGKVIEVPSKNRAIIQFKAKNLIERALLCYHNLNVDGKPIPPGLSILNFINIGTILKFVCHSYDETKKDKCGWFVISAWREFDTEPALGRKIRRVHGFHNCKGTITQVTKRQGYLMYNDDDDGSQELVAFLASHVYISEKHPCKKINLKTLYDFKPGQTVMFDAVPCDPEDNKNGCRWFATAVWREVKPLLEYDKPLPDPRVCPCRPDDVTQLSVMKRLTSDPQSLFLCSYGKIKKVLSNEYAIAYCEIYPPQPDLVLFHRSVVVVFGYCVVNTDLHTIFKEGDGVRFVAAAVPIGRQRQNFQWVASRVTVSTDPSDKLQ